MVKRSIKRNLIKVFVLCYLAGMLFQCTPSMAWAEGTAPTVEEPSTSVDPTSMTSTEMAKNWGFATEVVPESSQKRQQQSSVNPMGATKDTVKTFGETPMEIAVIGGKLFNTNDIEDADYDTRSRIKFYDHFKNNDGWLENTANKSSVTDSRIFRDVKDVMPSKTVAADINGDGIDEILRYCIDINGDGEIGTFNDHDDGVTANYKLQVITNSNKIEGEISLHKLSNKAFDDVALPEPLEYSSYLQMTAGDFDNDGMNEVAVLVPGKDSSTGELMIYGSKKSGSITLEKEYTEDIRCYTLKDQMTAVYLTTGDADNDGVKELVYTYTADVNHKDEKSSLSIMDYADGQYKYAYDDIVKFNGEALGTEGDPVGNCGVTVGDIDNDGLNEVVVGGYMVNVNTKDDNTYTNKSANGKEKTDKYYHELAMSYMKMEYQTDADGNITSKAYGNFKGFTVFEDDWDTAYGGNTVYDSDSRSRFGKSKDWAIPMQAVSLTGNVGGKTNDQIFFENFMYYYNSEYGRFLPYDDVYDSKGEMDDDVVLCKNVHDHGASIKGFTVGSFLSEDPNYLPAEGKEQLFISYMGKWDEYSHEIAVYYQDTGSTTPKDVKKIKNSIGKTSHEYQYYPDVCAANLDNDATFVQFCDYQFNYTKPEVLTVLAAAPYFEDVMNYNDYEGGGNYNPGQTYIRKTSGSSSTKGGFAEFKLGAYVSFEDDISVLGIKIASVEWEASFSANTSYEWRKTIEHSSSITYSTDGGQDSVVVVSAPQDTYFYRCYKDESEFLNEHPGANKDDPSTWPVIAVNIPGALQSRVIPVDTYNQLANTYSLDKIDSSFWEHTNGDPGTYPSSKNGFKNAKNILSTDTMSLNAGAGGVSREVSVNESVENEYTVSLTTGAKFGGGVGGVKTGVTFEATAGFAGVEASFHETTFGAELGNFLGDATDPDDMRSGYFLTTQLHSYTKEFNDNNIVVLDYTVNSFSGRPKLPNDFRSTEQQSSKVTLAWDIPEKISDGLKPDSIELQRYDNFYKKFIPVKTFDTVTLGDSMTYDDTGVYPEEKYKYRLKVVKLSKENYAEIDVETPPYGAPAEIYKQPRDITAQAGTGVTFTVEAGLPEYADPTRLYYEWYKRMKGEKTWTRVVAEDVPESNTLTLDSVTSDMNETQFYCVISRMIKNSTKRVTTNSDFAVLNVTSGIPQRYSVNLGTTLYGTIEAAQIAACGRQYPVYPGDTLYQGTKVKFTAIPDKGYGIASWAVNNAKQDTYDPSLIFKLNEDTTVSAAFNTFLYNVAFDIIPNTQQSQGGANWGTLKAVTNSTVLPIGETTALNSRMPVIFTAAPKNGYAINYWTLNGERIKNSDGTDFIGRIYTFNPVSQDTEIKVQFMKSENYSIKVIKQITDNGVTYIDDSRLDISVDGLNNKDVPFKGTEAVLSAARGAEAVINLTPPTSAILDSWTVDGVPQKVEVPSLNLSNIAKDTTILVNYKIFFSKAVNYSASGADGTVTAVLKSENSKETKPIISGTSVQMDQFAELTAQPKENLGIKTWLVNGKDMQTQDSTIKVKIMGNTSVTAVFESVPKTKEPVDKVSITGPVTKPVLASALAFDPDGDEVCFESISAQPDGKVAVVSLDPGAKCINITGVDKGSTSVKVIISDGKSHTVEVEIPIVVANADQKAPTGLEGVEVTDNFIANGKITGLVASKIYEYKKAGSSEYFTFSGGTELKFLEAGNYNVRYAAIKGYNAGADCTVKVPAYKPVYYTSIYANPIDGGTIVNPLDDGKTTVSGYYLTGTDVTAQAKANQNYVFEGWWSGDKILSTEPSYTFKTGSKNTVIEALFKPVETILETGNVTVTTSVIGSENSPINGITLKGTGNYKVGESVTVSVYGKPESCEFAYWKEGDNLVSYNQDYAFIQPAGNRNLTAYFQKSSYNVTVSSSDDSRGTVSGTDLYKVGSTVTIIAKPIGSLFDYWTIGGEIAGMQSTLTFTMMPKDIQIVAHFKPLSHLVSLIANPDSAGTLTGSKLYSEGDMVTITVSAKDGYEFAGWTENGVAVSEKPEYTFNLGQTDRCFVANFLKTWQVIFDKNGGSADASPTKLAVVYGKTVKKLPVNPTRSGYNFKGWNTAADGTGKAFSEATQVIGDITVYAQWELFTPTNGTGITNTTPQPDTTQKTVTQPEDIKPNAPSIKSENGITTITLGTTVKSKGAGIVEAFVSTDEVKDAISQSDKKALDSKKSVIIDVYPPENTKVIETYIDPEALKLISDSKAETLVIKTNIAVLTFDRNTIDLILKEASGNIKIAVTSYGVSELKGLTDEQRKNIGSCPIYDFSISSRDNLISDLGGNVLVTVPYTLKLGEDPNAIVISSINKENAFEAIANCVYDSKKGTITFSTSSLSRYAVLYNKPNFKDISDTAWYRDAVIFAFARGITTGSGDGVFNPDGKLTRAQFLVMVMRAYGIKPESNPVNNFADAGKTYYSGYLANAKALKLARGTGSNRFTPEQTVTRQEMFTLLYNILKYLDKLPTGNGTNNIQDFSDVKEISTWAVDGMTLFVKAGIISGENGCIMPKTFSTRAQIVQILYKLLSK